jgi:uncharacterized protein (DUF305 family)
MKNTTKLVLFGGVIGLVLGLMLSPVLFRGSIYKCGNTKCGQTISTIDQTFIIQMIPHHEGAITMAQLALEKAEHPELKTLAQNIITAQQKEIGDMRGWYTQWYGSDVPTPRGAHNMQDHMMMEGMTHMNSMSGDMEALRNSKNFDVEFIRQMIPHHEMAVMMAQMLQASTNRPEMKTLAENIITSQTQEIEQMRVWATAWSK